MVSPSAVIATEWVLFILAVILVCARITMHIQMRFTTLHLSDAFLTLAVAAALGLLICDTLTYSAGAMNNFVQPTVMIWKVRFATNYFFDFGVYLPKFSMLASYYRIIPRTAPQSRNALYAITAFIAISSLITLFADTFWCGSDVTVNWSDAKTDCTVFTSIELVKMNWALHFASEIFLFLLPLPLVNGLSLIQKREKAGLLLVFSLGAITISVSTARFVAMMILSNDIMIYILATAEFTIAIMILSLISLRPLLRRIGRAMTSFSHSGSSPLSRSQHQKIPSFGTYVAKDKSEPLGLSKTATPVTTKNPYPSLDRRQSMYGSEIELTEQDSGRIYKTEEVTVTYSRSLEKSEGGSDYSPGFGNADAETRVNSMTV